jgi:hypothetical protein
MSADDSLPDDVITLKAMLREERAARLAAEAEAQARTLLIEKLKLTIKSKRCFDPTFRVDGGSVSLRSDLDLDR